jgi:hypothetical protein
MFYAPYGQENEDGWLIYLIAKYLSESRQELLHLVCNGCYSLCLRDKKHNWRRPIDGCTVCSAEQTYFGSVVNIDSCSLSSFIEPADILLADRTVNQIPTEELISAKFAGFELFPFALPTLKSRFGAKGNFEKYNHYESILRQIFRGCILTYIAGKRLTKKNAINLVITAGEKEYLLAALVLAVKEAMIPRYYIRYDLSRRCLVVHIEHINQIVEIPFVSDALSLQYQAPNLWPSAVKDAIELLFQKTEILFK